VGDISPQVIGKQRQVIGKRRDVSNKYTVHFTTVASTTVQVEADDPDEAIDRAYNEVYVSLCHQCAHEMDLGGEWEAEAVTDESGKTLWEEKPYTRAT
jgi:hypothetical protein